MKRHSATVLAAGLLFSGMAIAKADGPLDNYKTLSGSLVAFSLSSEYSNATLTVSGPNGYYAKSYSETGSPSIDLIRTGGTADGTYSYEITAASSDTVVEANPMDNGRGAVDPASRAASVSASGSFVANGGLIANIQSSASESE